MSAAKHTPGPWIEGLDASGVVVVERLTATRIAALGPFADSAERVGVRLANARLIAAAPALAKALSSLLTAIITSSDGIPEGQNEHEPYALCVVCGNESDPDLPYDQFRHDADASCGLAVAALRKAGRLP